MKEFINTTTIIFLWLVIGIISWIIVIKLAGGFRE